jgi:hypothetical protein
MIKYQYTSDPAADADAYWESVEEENEVRMTEIDEEFERLCKNADTIRELLAELEDHCLLRIGELVRQMDRPGPDYITQAQQLGVLVGTYLLGDLRELAKRHCE